MEELRKEIFTRDSLSLSLSLTNADKVNFSWKSSRSRCLAPIGTKNAHYAYASSSQTKGRGKSTRNWGCGCGKAQAKNGVKFPAEHRKYSRQVALNCPKGQSRIAKTVLGAWKAHSWGRRAAKMIQRTVTETRRLDGAVRRLRGRGGELI